MNQSKSDSKVFAIHVLQNTRILKTQVARSKRCTFSHKLAPFSALFPDQHSPRVHSYITPQHSVCISLLPFDFCSTQRALIRSCPCSAFCTLVLPPDCGAACATTSHARLLLLSIAASVHVVRYCHTSCSTAHRLAQVDWLTCRISSAAITAATGTGKPFLFGTGLLGSYRRACTS